MRALTESTNCCSTRHLKLFLAQKKALIFKYPIYYASARSNASQLPVAVIAIERRDHSTSLYHLSISARLEISWLSYLDQTNTAHLYNATGQEIKRHRIKQLYALQANLPHAVQKRKVNSWYHTRSII